MPFSITMSVLQWPTKPEQVWPHAKSIGQSIATGLAKDVRGSIWRKPRFVRWTGKSFEAWKGEGTATGGVILWNNAQNKAGVPYVPYVHLTRTPPSAVLVIDVRALAVAFWQPEWVKRLNADMAPPKVKQVVIRA